jgi:hypothetical protein
MSEFKVGDRVRTVSGASVTAGWTGTVCCLKSGGSIGIRFDNEMNMLHDCDGACGDWRGWYVTEDCLTHLPSDQSGPTVMASLKMDGEIGVCPLCENAEKRCPCSHIDECGVAWCGDPAVGGRRVHGGWTRCPMPEKADPYLDMRACCTVLAGHLREWFSRRVYSKIGGTELFDLLREKGFELKKDIP